MAELYVGSKVKGYKQTIFYKENGGTGSEIIEISMKVSGKKSQEIMKRAEESTDKLLDNIRELLKEEQQEAVQEKDLSVRYKCDGKKEKCQKKICYKNGYKGENACMHTKDIRHAENFKKHSSGSKVYWETADAKVERDIQ
jgi:hypothetical protein